MVTRLALMGLGLYVCAVWVAVGLAAYHWLGQSPRVEAAKIMTSSECSKECGVLPTMARLVQTH